jgi:hypothetical protein
MLQLETGLSRRRFLESSIGLGAFVLPRTKLAAAPQEPTHAGKRAKSVIVLLLEGGMSQLDTWDPRPHAPAEIRGSFSTIPTTNPELTVGEHMPRLATQAHLYNVVQSAYMDNARRDHSPGLHWVLTGYDNQAAGVSMETENDSPSVGAIVAHETGPITPYGLPSFVTVPSRRQLRGRVNYTRALHLGGACDALESGAVPDRADGPYAVPMGLTLPADVSLGRLQDRRALLKTFDQLHYRREKLASHLTTVYQRQAFNLLLRDRGRQAFDINQEPPHIRNMYGNSYMGQRALLARRLVEAGVTYVLVNFSINNSWDHHRRIFHKLKDNMLPAMDQATSALLSDLEQRGLLDDVLVLQTGEMGRTPKINEKSGRDHWPDVFSLMIAGGGLTRGQTLGSSDRKCEYPHTRPVHFHEVLATVYHQLGIDPNLVIHDRQDRPIRILPEAEPVHELIRS